MSLRWHNARPVPRRPIRHQYLYDLESHIKHSPPHGAVTTIPLSRHSLNRGSLTTLPEYHTKWLFCCFSSTGNCSMSISRWYFNLKSRQCEEFTYTGCLGNGNNFASLFVCQEKCTVGACCQRAQSRSGVIGYTPDGYDK